MLAYTLYLHTLKAPSENIITFSTVKNNWKKILLYLPRYLTVLFIFLNSKCFMCTFNKKFSFFVKNCFTIIIDQVIIQWILLVFSTLEYIYFMFMLEGYFYWIRALDWLFSTLKSLLHFVLATILLDEISTIIQIIVLLWFIYL